jgi:hypothetical protein
MESVKQLSRAVDFGAKLQLNVVQDVIQANGDLDLRVQLGKRTESNSNVPNEDAIAAIRLAFRDVAGNGGRSPSHLRRKLESVVRWQIVRKFVCGQCEVHGGVPDLEITKRSEQFP